MPEQSVLLEQVRRHWESNLAGDVDRAHEMYHDDAVLEFPQSGERYEGAANFREWRRRYPADVSYRVRRITTREDLVVVEVSVSYNGGPWQYGVQLLEFRDDKVARERIYVMEGWEGTKLAGALALGHSRGPAGVKHPHRPRAGGSSRGHLGAPQYGRVTGLLGAGQRASFRRVWAASSKLSSAHRRSGRPTHRSDGREGR